MSLSPAPSTRNGANNDDKQYKCPFPRCERAYTRIGKLRNHLIQQSQVKDEIHQGQKRLWEDVSSQGLLTIHTRPKNLTEDEKHRRKLAAGKRCWSRNRERYRSNQQTSRANVKLVLEAAAKLTTLHRSKSEQVQALQSVSGSKSVVSTLYTISPDLATWIRKDVVDEQTFPRFVTYFYPPSAWPYVVVSAQSKEDHTSVEKQLFLDALPNKKHYKEMLRRIHPDKASSLHATTQSDSINSTPPSPITPYETRRHAEDSVSDTSAFPSWCATTLNAGFVLWGPLLEDDLLKQAELFVAEKEQEFRDLSTNHDSLVDLYWTWVDIALEAKEALLPGNLSSFDIEQAFTGKEPGGEVVVRAENQFDEAEGEEEELWNKLSMVSPPRKRKRWAPTVDDGERRIDDEERGDGREGDGLRRSRRLMTS